MENQRIGAGVCNQEASVRGDGRSHRIHQTSRRRGHLELRRWVWAEDEDSAAVASPSVVDFGADEEDLPRRRHDGQNARAAKQNGNRREEAKNNQGK